MNNSLHHQIKPTYFVCHFEKRKAKKRKKIISVVEQIAGTIAKSKHGLQGGDQYWSTFIIFPNISQYLSIFLYMDCKVDQYFSTFLKCSQYFLMFLNINCKVDQYFVMNVKFYIYIKLNISRYLDQYIYIYISYIYSRVRGCMIFVE